MKLKKYCKHIILGVFSIWWLFPVAALVVSLVKDGSQYVNLGFWELPPLMDIPGNLLINFNYALLKTDILTGVANTLLYAGVAAVGAALAASLAGYALVHLNVKRPQLWFALIFGGNLLPFQMFLLPLYIGSSAVGLYDTRLGFTIIYLGICIPFALFLYRNYASKVPPALIDAARVDGCTDFMVFRHVFLPITKPAFLSVFVIQFIWGWNNLLFGMVLTEDARPVMAAVAKLSPSRGYTPVPVILAGSLLASIPTILVFLFLHQYFVEGLAIRANK